MVVSFVLEGDGFADVGYATQKSKVKEGWRA